jgi:hypothetical protein
MKIEKANWIEAIDQPCALLIGLTNSVQPYWRLAIITMQTTQIARKPQRIVAELSESTKFDAVDIFFSLDAIVFVVGKKSALNSPFCH